MKTKFHLFLWPSLAVILLDRITKMAVLRHLDPYESIPVITGFMNLVSVRNRGMAFGILNRPHPGGWSTYVLLGTGILAVGLLGLWLTRLKDEEIRIVPGLALILGGALGNLFDRIRFQEVIDFLDFHVGSFHWPAFNIADSAITIGTIWVMIFLIFHKKGKES